MILLAVFAVAYAILPSLDVVGGWLPAVDETEVLESIVRGDGSADEKIRAIDAVERVLDKRIRKIYEQLDPRHHLYIDPPHGPRFPWER